MGNEMMQVKVMGIVVDPKASNPVVVLVDLNGQKALPIWIGVFEANAIALKIENVSTPRPMTHDLIKNFLDKLEISIEKVVVNDVRDNTFYALIHCRHKGNSIVIDSRPSDAIALSLRVNAPIFVEDEVVKKAHSLKFEENLEDSEKLKKWLESLRPENLGKYKM